MPVGAQAGEKGSKFHSLKKSQLNSDKPSVPLEEASETLLLGGCSLPPGLYVGQAAAGSNLPPSPCPKESHTKPGRLPATSSTGGERLHPSNDLQLSPQSIDDTAGFGGVAITQVWPASQSSSWLA